MIVRASLLLLAACSAPPKPAPAPAPPPLLVKKYDLAELERPALPKLLAIDWSTVQLASSADALALWARIAPTGLDWEDKLGELPDAVLRPLAVALVEGGNFTCTPPTPTRDCAIVPLDVRDPKQTETFADPCLRRLLALWAIDKLDDADFTRLAPHLRTIVTIPPPESELPAAILASIPDAEQALRLDLAAHAWRAGQTDVVNGAVGKLDEPHLIEAVTKHHIEGALEILSAEGHRATYLAAVTDELATPRARTRAMFDLVATDDIKPAPDVTAALVKATAAKDCAVAATAARLLQQFGDTRFVPTRPRNATSPERMLRALCILASYEQQQAADEASLLASFVPKRGLERITVTYDPLGEVDEDGDGDVHTKHDALLVTPDQLALPEIDDLVKSFARCTGTVCKSEDREFRFTFKRIGAQLLLTRLELSERPPCPKP